MAFSPKSGMTNLEKLSTEKGYFIGAWGYETQIINSSGTFIGSISPSSLELADGSAADPSLSFINSPTTGAFRKAADSLGFSAAGTEVGSYSSSGAWTIGPSGGTGAHIFNGLNLDLTVSSASGSRIRALNTGSGDAILALNVSGAGDPHIHFDGSGVGTAWHAGVDNSASDVFTIGAGLVPGTTDYITISTAGVVTIGASGNTAAHTFNGTLYGSANVANSVVSTLLRLDQLRASTAAHARLELRTPSTGGDPTMFFNITSGSSWSIGADNSTSDSFKVSQASALGTNDYLTITTAGVFTIGPSGNTSFQTINGPVFVTTSVGASAATYILDVRQTRASASSHCDLGLRVSGTTGGDPKVSYIIPSGTTWSEGVDNSDSDTFKISNSTALGTNDYLTITTGGVVTIGTGTSTTHRLNTTVATGATAGADTLPANPVGFITININGTNRKIPYYAT